jgi:hypothetical protein
MSSRIIKAIIYNQYPRSHCAIYYDPKIHKETDILFTDHHTKREGEHRVVGFHNNVMEYFEGTLEQLGEHCEKYFSKYRGNKDFSPAIGVGVLKVQIIGDKEESFPYRRNSNIEEMYLLPYDLDNKHPTNIIAKETILKILNDSGYEYLLHETATSKPNRYKCHIFLVLDNPIQDQSYYKHVYMNVARELFGEELFNLTFPDKPTKRAFIDVSCKNPCGLLYIGSGAKIRNRTYREGKAVCAEDFAHEFIDPLKKNPTKIKSAKVEKDSSIKGDNKIYPVRWDLRKEAYQEAIESVGENGSLKAILEHIASNGCYDGAEYIAELLSRDRATVQIEYDWFRAIREILYIAQLMDDIDSGKKLANSLSKVYPDYDIVETRSKIDRNLEWIEASYKDYERTFTDEYIEAELKDAEARQLVLKEPSSKFVSHTEGQRLMIKAIIKNFREKGILVNTCAMGMGKTYCTVEAIRLFIKKYPNEKFAIFSPRYGSLDPSFQYSMEKLNDEMSICAIPKLVNNIDLHDNMEIPALETHCPSVSVINNHRSKGFDYNSRVCRVCPKRSTCRLHHERERANTQEPDIIFATSRYLTRESLKEKWITGRHIILDEDQMNDLLNVSEISLIDLERFRNTLQDCQYKALTELLKNIIQEIIDDVETLIAFGHGAKVATQVLPTPDLNIFQPDDEQMTKGIHILQTLYREEILDSEDASNLLPQLLSLNTKTLFVQKKDSTFSLFFCKPVDLSSAKSITILDATASTFITKKLLRACNVSPKRLRRINLNTTKLAPLHRATQASFSRQYIKNRMTPATIRKYTDNINNFIEEQGIKNVATISFLNREDHNGKYRLPNLKKIEQGIKNRVELPPELNFHFWGSFAGNNNLGNFFKTNGSEDQDENLLIIIGTPRLPSSKIAVLAYALGIFKANQIQPEYLFRNNETPIFLEPLTNNKLATAGFASTVQGKLSNWQRLELHSVQSHLMQILGRSIFRGTPTLLLSNYPIGNLLPAGSINPLSIKKQDELNICATTDAPIKKAFEQAITTLKNNGKKPKSPSVIDLARTNHPELQKVLEENKSRYERLSRKIIKDSKGS